MHVIDGKLPRAAAAGGRQTSLIPYTKRSPISTLVVVACFVASWLGVAATILSQPLIQWRPREEAGYSVPSPSRDAVLVVTPSMPDYTGPGVHSLFIHSDLRWRLETSFTLSTGVVADSGTVLGVSYVDGVYGSDCRLIGIDGTGRVFLQEIRRRHQPYYVLCNPPCAWEPNVLQIVLSKAGGVGIFISQEHGQKDQDSFVEWWTYAAPGGEHRWDQYVPLPKWQDYGFSALFGTAALDDSPHVVCVYYVQHGHQHGAHPDTPALEFRVYDIHGFMLWNAELEEPAFNGMNFQEAEEQFEREPHCGSRPGGFFVRTSVSEQSFGLYREGTEWPWWKVRRTGVDMDKDK